MTQDTALAILKTGTNVFLTGEPGSGKSYLVSKYIKYLRSHGLHVAITASTGIAGTHISGTTIHSWSGIGIRKMLSERDLVFIASEERIAKKILAADVLVIDEISMLDGSTLDLVDRVCRSVRNSMEPFGGLQVVVVGDFFQLPPIHRTGEEPKQFAYAAPSWVESMFTICYLTEQHRQSDTGLSGVLSDIRRGEISEETKNNLHARHLQNHNDQTVVTKLFTHNADVDVINAEQLAKLPGEAKLFTMSSTGQKAKVEQLKRGCLSPEKLELKIGAVVMCTRNNPELGFVNGTLGTIISFDKESGHPVMKTHQGRIITVVPSEWSIEEGEKFTAVITQLPLRLAWAITVHKSQGMSLDAAVMDLSRTFAYGQGYVALSRVRSLAGLHLLGWNERSLMVDPDIQTQDMVMRAQSEQAEIAWQGRDERAQREAQEDFIRHCGGKLEANAEMVPGEVTELPPHTKRLAEIRKSYPQAYTPWTTEQDEHLAGLFKSERQVAEMAKELERHPGGIRSRLKKLGLVQ